MSDAIARALQEAGIKASAEQIERLAEFERLVIEQNKVMNLTAITDPVEFAQKHIADSLLPLTFGLLPENARCVDVGSGAGFPGIPLLIMRPDLRLTLLDSLQKRVNFMQAALKAMGLEAGTVHARAEDAGRDANLRDCFDIAFSRAVAPAPVLIELVMPLVKPEGRAIAYKGPGAGEEFGSASNALQKLCCGGVEFKKLAAPWGERVLAIIQKRAATPRAYPRKAGTAQKKPL